ncbi:MAG TPA: ribosome biogenesis GTPase Der [Chitinophagales bacterium]|nr:ribosome biogenesis GTPase Der [Chitinophagales bacterium]
MSYTVAIIGRPNVGKSTLFNRLLEERKAITDDFSGVTRDRQYGITEWNGKTFNVIDTGGFVLHSEDVFEKAIRGQVRLAIEESDLMIFMVDVTTGITDLDESLAQELRKTKKPVVICVNKVDNTERSYAANEFYGLGFENLFSVSCMSGSGTGEILDFITEQIPDDIENAVDIYAELPKITIVGQPNVGKSTLLNALIGEERNIVTDIAGTTRDSIHTHYNLYGKEFLLVDTAGIRKKNKVHEDLEFYSVIRAVKAIEESDVCILMLDATVGIELQDLKIFSIIEQRKKGIVILVNKWDAIEKDSKTILEFEKRIKDKIAPFTDIPIVFVSALEKQRIYQAIDKVIEVYNNKQIKVPTHKLNEIMLAEIEKYGPPAYRGEYIKIKYVQQLPSHTPSFAFFCNHPDFIREPYKNYLENRMREHFPLTGVPINIFFRKK